MAGKGNNILANINNKTTNDVNTIINSTILVNLIISTRFSNIKTNLAIKYYQCYKLFLKHILNTQENDSLFIFLTTER